MQKNKGRIATIKDVAQLAGTSISTVSRVINNSGGVSPKLQVKIERAIEQLDYRSNSVARALRMQSTKTLGLIVPSVENPAFGLLSKSIESTAHRYGFSIILCNSDGNLEREVQYMQLLLNKQVDGILFNAIGLYDERFLDVLRSHVPLVVIGQKIVGLATPNVTTDNRKGAFDAVSYLLSTGLKRIAFIFGLHESVTALEDRFKGYHEALISHGIPLDESLVVRNTASLSGGNAVEQLLRNEVVFDAIFAANDLIAFGCIKQLRSHGYRIPEDISVMGYDMTPFSQMWYPSLSTVNSHLDLLGQEAVKAILRIVYTGKSSLDERVLNAELHLGGTTRAISTE